MSHDQTRLGRGDQFGLDRGGWAACAAPLAGLPGLAEQPVQGGQRAQVGALVEQGGVHLGRRGVGEPVRVQRGEDLPPARLVTRRGAAARSRCGTGGRRGGAGLARCRRYQLACATPDGRARRPGADSRREQGDGLVGHGARPV